MWAPRSDQSKGGTLKILQMNPHLTKYELRSLEIENFDMGGFKTTK
jgi:hypothetical protein